jgi:hypothetical protein
MLWFQFMKLDLYAVHPMQPDPFLIPLMGRGKGGEGEGGRRFIDFQSGFLELNKHNVRIIRLSGNWPEKLLLKLKNRLLWPAISGTWVPPGI